MKSKTTSQLALCFCCAALASCVELVPQTHKHTRGNLDHPPGPSRYLVDDNERPPNPLDNPDPTGVTLTTPTPPPINPPINTPPVVTPTPPVTVTPPPAPGNQIPYGKPVAGKKGFVYSPFDDKAGMIDVRDYSPGTKVRDPYTNKIFLVP